ncbi:MAG: hypothetical protein ACFCGT_22270 [Sandaracinaceae bacterium]
MRPGPGGAGGPRLHAWALGAGLLVGGVGCASSFTPSVDGARGRDDLDAQEVQGLCEEAADWLLRNDLEGLFAAECEFEAARASVPMVAAIGEEAAQAGCRSATAACIDLNRVSDDPRMLCGVTGAAPMCPVTVDDYATCLNEDLDERERVFKSFDCDDVEEGAEIPRPYDDPDSCTDLRTVTGCGRVLPPLGLD